MASERSRLVLASASSARRALLESAGLDFEVDPADVDEAAIRDDELSRGGDDAHERVALRLADAKALAVSAHHSDAIVIGADQVLSFEGRLLEKAASIEEAREILSALRGKTHALHSAVALARNGDILWREIDTACLTMRPFSDAALDNYLSRAGTAALTSVGAYQIEGPAIQLFESLEGDHATILGLPLMSLLGELHRQKALLA